MLSNLTFVSAFIDVYETPFEDKDIYWRSKLFENIAKTGIQICLYIDAPSKPVIDSMALQYPNIKVMKYLDIKDTWAYSQCKEVEDITLPDHRNIPKDTIEYMCLINSKIEFMKDAIENNPFASTHFAWIDFSIFYVFKNYEKTSNYLKTLSYRTFKPRFLMIPGCWSELSDINRILNNVFWRFCGGFLIGDKESIFDFHTLYIEHFPTFLKTHKKLVWEVNFWAWLEVNTSWAPTWVSGDHNDRILDLWCNIQSLCVADHATSCISYDYMDIDSYRPTSASYLFYKNRHILNTRYVNYVYHESGKYCIIHDSNSIIRTKNILSILDNNFMPTNYLEMSEENIGLPSKPAKFCGLEDIRLYECNGELRYIATNIDYSPNTWNLMIRGIYDVDALDYKESRLLYSPGESWCEKNWIPLIKRGCVDEEYFIYKWSPMEIGKINEETNQLEICLKYNIASPFFSKVRGSTIFTETNEGLLGIVHFSEDKLPRHYYHMFVLLDKTTFKPLKYSENFYFQEIGIEFCIGFNIKDDNYYFWISKFDREPKLLISHVEKYPLKFDFIFENN